MTEVKCETCAGETVGHPAPGWIRFEWAETARPTGYWYYRTPDLAEPSMLWRDHPFAPPLTADVQEARRAVVALIDEGFDGEEFVEALDVYAAAVRGEAEAEIATIAEQYQEVGQLWSDAEDRAIAAEARHESDLADIAVKVSLLESALMLEIGPEIGAVNAAIVVGRALKATGLRALLAAPDASAPEPTEVK